MHAVIAPDTTRYVITSGLSKSPRSLAWQPEAVSIAERPRRVFVQLGPAQITDLGQVQVRAAWWSCKEHCSWAERPGGLLGQELQQSRAEQALPLSGPAVGGCDCSALILAQRCFVTQPWLEKSPRGNSEKWGDAAEPLHQVGAEGLFSEFEGFVYRRDRIGMKGLC